MKITNLKYVLLSLIGLMLCSFSCSDSEDFVVKELSPVELKLYVMDDYGNNLLNVNAENNLLNNEIKVINNGYAFVLDTTTFEEEAKEPTPAHTAVFYGLKLMKDQNGEPYICIGEFDGDRSFSNEIITVDLGDNTYSTIKYDSRLSWWKNEATVHRFYFLDKEMVENPLILYKKNQ